MTQKTAKTMIETEAISTQATWVSAFVDGETTLPADGLNAHSPIIEQYFHYQLIRQTLRGACMTSAVTESISWHQSRLSQLWSRVDALSSGQDA